MSVGALSPEAHRDDRDRDEPARRAQQQRRRRRRAGSLRAARSRGDWDGSRTKQVASARFGVTPAYLRSADELQIKIAQGSKPGEGGQLPGMKVVPHIARLRHAQPGTPLISPPVHHDIYSIEDLAQLIYDLRAFHPPARMNVKLVASIGVGIIAAGVAKAGADAIQISGHDGGTGASPRASIKHAGMPWEIGLPRRTSALTRAGLRGRVVLQTDGGLKTGRDIAIAAALGADEYGFGTAALVAIGCVMARQCHANTCPVGIATQRDDLRARFAGTPDMLIGYLRLDCRRSARRSSRRSGLRAPRRSRRPRRSAAPPRGVMPSVDDVDRLLRTWTPAAARPVPKPRDSARRIDVRGRRSHPIPIGRCRSRRSIGNTDRAFGAAIAGAIAARHGDAGLPDGSVPLSMTGSARPELRRVHAARHAAHARRRRQRRPSARACTAARSSSRPRARERGRAEQVLAGNAALYGATGGRLFIAGRAGERFAVRNSGATAVVEGVGDHACEYMTGGVVLCSARPAGTSRPA